MAASATVPKEKIAEKAYEIFVSRGKKPGSDLDDWLQAERELARSVTGGSTVPFPAKKNRNSNNNLKYSYLKTSSM